MFCHHVVTLVISHSRVSSGTLGVVEACSVDKENCLWVSVDLGHPSRMVTGYKINKKTRSVKILRTELSAIKFS